MHASWYQVPYGRARGVVVRVGGSVKATLADLYILTGLAISPLLLVAVWMWWPYSPPVSYGEIATATYKGCRLYTDRTAMVLKEHYGRLDRVVVHESGKSIILPANAGAYTEGQKRLPRVFNVSLPEAGHWTFFASMTYEPNPLRQITIAAPPIPFSVTADEIEKCGQ